jgi:hypothetical protein
VKALTVKQPWAWAIAAGYKTIENRATNWSYRGPLAIHAGARYSRRGWASPLIQAAQRASTPEVAKLADIRGAIIAVTQLTDVHPDTGCCRPWGESAYRDADGRTRTQLVHLVLADIAPVTPIDCPGKLGLWIPPDHIRALLAAAPCCPHHSPTCEPTSELCCTRCPEYHHGWHLCATDPHEGRRERPSHHDGTPCILDTL